MPSRYRRIQRFFSEFPLDYQQIAGFIFKLFFCEWWAVVFKHGSNQLALRKIRHQYLNARHWHCFQRNGHPNLLDVTGQAR